MDDYTINYEFNRKILMEGGGGCICIKQQHDERGVEDGVISIPPPKQDINALGIAAVSTFSTSQL